MFDRVMIRALLRTSLDDHRLSRAEKKTLKAALQKANLRPADVDEVRREAFEMAHSEAAGGDVESVLIWLEDTVRTIDHAVDGPHDDRRAEAHFSPGLDCRSRICELIARARSSADICVFTITDDHISEAIVNADGRGVDVRIITDDDKSHDLGSDIDKLRRAGIEVRVDYSDSHMHHKFAVVDRQWLVTGSYNWTRSAFRSNQGEHRRVERRTARHTLRRGVRQVVARLRVRHVGVLTTGSPRDMP